MINSDEAEMIWFGVDGFSGTGWWIDVMKSDGNG